jgi:hypothetical protein
MFGVFLFHLSRPQLNLGRSMPFRRLLLRILFVSLTAAAVLGAAGVLLASAEAMWRIVWTCIATAVASLLLLATGLLARREKNAAVAGAGLIIVEYLLTLTFVWDLWRWEYGQHVAVTMFLLAACGVPAIAFIHLGEVRTTRLAARVGLILAAACFVVFMIPTWIITRGTWENRWYEIGWALSGFGILAVLCLIGAKSGVDQHHWRWLGVVASIIGFAIAVYAIVLQVYSNSPLFTTIIVIAAVIAHANVLLRVPLGGNQIYLRWVTTAAGCATGACIVFVSFHNYADPAYELGQRLAGAAAIVAGCGTLALLVLARINSKLHAPPPELEAIKQVSLVCPFCQKKQNVPPGESRCAGCGLILELRISEPRCPACNYSLLMLTSDRCPECGATVTPTALQT